MTKIISVERKNSKKEVYHTNEDCKRIKSTTRPVAQEEIEYHELTLCQYCDPDKNPKNRTKQDRSYQEALKAEAKKNE